MLGKVFSESEIIGSVPKPLNEKLAWQIGYATAQFLTQAASDAGFDDPMMRHVLVGRDMRKNGGPLCDSLKRGIRDAGAHVIDVGQVDTPLLSFAINLLSCAGGVQTTASHRSANYNGFRIARMGATPVGMVTGLDDIRRLAAMASADKVPKLDGREESRDLWEPYADHVRQFLSEALFDPDTPPMRVVVDASNGMAGKVVPRAFADVPQLEVIRLNFDYTKGEFTHDPNPLIESNLKELKEAVVREGANFGACFDGDADSLVVVDDRGHSVGSDLLTAILIPRFLADEPGAAIVHDLRSSRAVPEIVREAGGKPVRARVGQVFMQRRMTEFDAVFGGDLAGHFYFRDNFYACSGAIAFATLLNLVAESEKPITKLVQRVRRYTQSGELKFKNEDREGTIERLKDAYPDAQVEEIDGVSIDLGEWWCNVRMSTTEPVIRLNLEGTSKTAVEIAVSEVSRYLGDRVHH